MYNTSTNPQRIYKYMYMQEGHNQMFTHKSSECVNISKIYVHCTIMYMYMYMEIAFIYSVHAVYMYMYTVYTRTCM